LSVASWRNVLAILSLLRIQHLGPRPCPQQRKPRLRWSIRQPQHYCCFTNEHVRTIPLQPGSQFERVGYRAASTAPKEVKRNKFCAALFN
jgi:hypothetical protein